MAVSIWQPYRKKYIPDDVFIIFRKITADPKIKHFSRITYIEILNVHFALSGHCEENFYRFCLDFSAAQGINGSKTENFYCKLTTLS